MPSHSLTPLTTMPQTGPVDVCTVVPAAQAGAAAAGFVDEAMATANVAPPTQACRYIDVVIASSPRVESKGDVGSVAAPPRRAAPSRIWPSGPLGMSSRAAFTTCVGAPRQTAHATQRVRPAADGQTVIPSAARPERPS